MNVYNVKAIAGISFIQTMFYTNSHLDKSFGNVIIDGLMGRRTCLALVRALNSVFEFEVTHMPDLPPDDWFTSGGSMIWIQQLIRKTCNHYVLSRHAEGDALVWADEYKNIRVDGQFGVQTKECIIGLISLMKKSWMVDHSAQIKAAEIATLPKHISYVCLNKDVDIAPYAEALSMALGGVNTDTNFSSMMMYSSRFFVATRGDKVLAAQAYTVFRRYREQQDIHSTVLKLEGSFIDRGWAQAEVLEKLTKTARAYAAENNYGFEL